MYPGVTLSIGQTETMTVVDANPQILTIRWIEGKLVGQEECISRRDAPVKIGRNGCNNKIEVHSCEVSRKHGCFIFKDDCWFYTLNGDRTTNGSWEVASFYDIDSDKYESHEGSLLRDGDVILIGQQYLKFNEI